MANAYFSTEIVDVTCLTCQTGTIVASIYCFTQLSEMTAEDQTEKESGNDEEFHWYIYQNLLCLDFQVQTFTSKHSYPMRISIVNILNQRRWFFDAV